MKPLYRLFVMCAMTLTFASAHARTCPPEYYGATRSDAVSSSDLSKCPSECRFTKWTLAANLYDLDPWFYTMCVYQNENNKSAGVKCVYSCDCGWFGKPTSLVGTYENICQKCPSSFDEPWIPSLDYTRDAWGLPDDFNEWIVVSNIGENTNEKRCYLPTSFTDPIYDRTGNTIELSSKCFWDDCYWTAGGCD